MKQCPICQQKIDLSKFAEHVANCNGSVVSRSTAVAKKCSVCRQDIPETEFVNHITNCRGQATPQNVRQVKKCITCGRDIGSDEYVNHVSYCNGRNITRSNDQVNMRTDYQYNATSRQSTTSVLNAHTSTRHSTTVESSIPKKCPFCKETTNDLKQHLGQCSSKTSRESLNGNSTRLEYSPDLNNCGPDYATKTGRIEMNKIPTTHSKEDRRAQSVVEKVCPLCKRNIKSNEYSAHLESCAEIFGSRRPDPQLIRCPICQKLISGDHQVHVNQCLDQLKVREPSPISCQQNQQKQESKIASSACGTNTHRDRSNECFECSIIVGNTKNQSHVIPCPFQHKYCHRCIEKKANQSIDSKIPPLCHSAFCNYELTRYDVWCLPLNATQKNELLACVKNKARQQCIICGFYIDCVEQDSFQKHVARCDVENHEPCGKCHVPMNRSRLNDHRQKCDKTTSYARILSYVEFLEPRTKYPRESHEIRYFIDYLRAQRLSTGAHNIIDTLAQFGETFPLDIPKRTCDICMDDFLFDDIFVFGCKDNHKACYKCFDDSCESKLTQKQCLTCPLCEHQLSDGEIKQLRVSSEKLEAYRKFQEDELFRRYAGRLIRCPRQGCKWAAEAMNPNEKFSIECRVCHYEFCSLCGQIPHPHATCREIPELTQRWFHWCNTERNNYWQNRAREDAQFLEQVRQHEQQREETTQRNVELQQRYQELLADEQFKAANCRLCPSCGRVVQKLDGCDSMICGQNYHGGDVQSGCGNRFAWSKATPYVPMAATGPNQINFDLPEPHRDEPLIHRNTHCSSCQNEVEGIRFDCIHCSALTFCERCEQRSTLEHAEELEAQNRTQHTFRLITRPETVEDD